MAHKISQNYATKGIDTRTNRLTMDPMSMREGTQNIIIDHNSDLTQRYGFGHVDVGGYVSLGEVEYKFTDPDTGESRSEIVQVRDDGRLYRRLQENGLSISSEHSLYFDGTTFRIVVGLVEITFDETKTLASLSSDLTTAGVTNSVLGDGLTLAYLLGTFVDETGSHYATTWEAVPYPDVILDGSNAEVWNTNPFPEADTGLALEGISAVNLNNCLYLTVGGFPLKYDGKMVYRAGVPKHLKANTVGSNTLSAYTVGAGATDNTSLPNGVYYYSFQFGYRDAQGATYWGFQDASLQEGVNSVRTATNSTDDAVSIGVKDWVYGKDFGAVSCVVNGTQTIAAGGGTLTVDAGHNVKVGMCLMQPVYILDTGSTRASSTFFGYYAAKVTAVTQTTIVLQTAIPGIGSFPDYTGTFVDNAVVGAGYVTPILENKYLIDFDTTGSTLSVSSVQEPFGAFVRVYRSKVGAPDVLYRVFDLPVPYQGNSSPNAFSVVYTAIDDKQDTALTELYLDNPTGEELPRACRYLTSWQNTLTQAGRPTDPSIANDKYPSWGNYPIIVDVKGDFLFLDEIYSEASLCDDQSLYWADQNNLEGFPRSGLNENRIDTIFNDSIKGIFPNKDTLFAFKERSTAVLRGDLGANDIVTEVLESDAGLLDHRSVQEVEGALIWCDADKGFYTCIAGRLPIHIGYSISDQFLNDEVLKTFAVAQNWARRDIYICYLPTKAFVFDYAERRGFWYEWTGSFKSLVATADDELFLSDGTRFWKAKDTLTRWDCSDYKSPISAKMVSAWYNFKYPTIDKKFHRVWINSIQGDFTVLVEQYANYLSTLVGSISLSFLPELTKKFVKKEVKTNMEKLSSLSIGISHNTAAERVKIQGWELEYSSDYDLGEPKN
jgi:hypothetical protein